jgi:hypothetical protein
MCFLLLATAPPPSAALATSAAAALLPRLGVRVAGLELHQGRRDDKAHEEKLNERRRCRCRVGSVVGMDDEQKRRSLAMAPAGQGEPQVK